jgi:hypothetical protein
VICLGRGSVLCVSESGLIRSSDVYVNARVFVLHGARVRIHVTENWYNNSEYFTLLSSFRRREDGNVCASSLKPFPTFDPHLCLLNLDLIFSCLQTHEIFLIFEGL